MPKENSQPKIRVFSTPMCPYCHTLKAFLDEKGFKFEDIDVSVDEKTREEMVNKTGQMGVPVIEIGGEIIIGFDKAKIVQKLGIKE